MIRLIEQPRTVDVHGIQHVHHGQRSARRVGTHAHLCLQQFKVWPTDELSTTSLAIEYQGAFAENLRELVQLGSEIRGGAKGWSRLIYRRGAA